jgi:hypothetical protein
VGVCAALDDFMATEREREGRLALLTEVLAHYPARLTLDELCSALAGEYYEVDEVARAFGDLVRFEVLYGESGFVLPGDDALCLRAVINDQKAGGEGPFCVFSLPHFRTRVRAGGWHEHTAWNPHSRLR